MTHSRFYRLQLRTISASFTNTQQQNANCKMILELFTCKCNCARKSIEKNRSSLLHLLPLAFALWDGLDLLTVALLTSLDYVQLQ